MATVYSKHRSNKRQCACSQARYLLQLLDHGRTYRTGKIWRQKSPFVYISGIFHILSKVSCFLIEILSFSQVTETIGFFPIQILIFRMLRNNADVHDAHISSLGYTWNLTGDSSKQFLALIVTVLEQNQQVPLQLPLRCQQKPVVRGLIDLSTLETTKSCLSRTGGINGVLATLKQAQALLTLSTRQNGILNTRALTLQCRW